MTASPAPPARFDEYRIVRELGRGAMGAVYQAHDELLDRAVAIKFLAAAQPGAHARTRFLREARAAARIHHPNVVALFRIGELGGRPFLVSELVSGRSLDRLPLPLPWTRALEIGLGLARGLEAAHQQGVVHRDVKPANAILADDGTVKLLDFGVALLAGDARVAAPAATPDRLDVTLDDPAPPAATLAAGEPGEPMRGLTHTGTLLGTPLYMPPEGLAGGPAGASGDLYSLGALLFELLAGRPPLRAETVAALLRAHAEGGRPALAVLAPAADARFVAAIERCLRSDPAGRFASAGELLDALEPLAERRPAAPPAGNPYRGLEAFEATHRDLFFGREPEIQALLGRLGERPALLVAGDSGTGKSSLVRAGLVPRIVDDGVLDGRSYRAVTLVPGKRPAAALAVALAPVIGSTAAELAERDPATLARELARYTGNDRGLLVFVDQLEELCTQAAPDQAVLLAEVIGALAAGLPGLRLVATARADFLARLAAMPGLGPLLDGLYLVRPLDREGLRRSIVGPAERAGLRFESAAMIEALVTSTTCTEGGLPLLQFALAELWHARDPARALLPEAALEALGGVGGALARHADTVLVALPAAQRAAARRMLVALVTLEGTRARRSAAELGATAGDDAAALEALVRGRLVCARDGEDGATFEIAHEALVGGWSALRGWLDELVTQRALHERLRAAANAWARLGRPREALWGPRQLREAEGAAAEVLPPLEAAFLASSRARLRRRRGGRVMVAAAVPLILVGGWTALRRVATAERDRRVAAQVEDATAAFARGRTSASESTRLRAAAFARFDARQVDQGEDFWRRAGAAADAGDREYLQAAQHAETALLLDGAREDARSLLADALDARARAAEQARDPVRLREILGRLALHDQGGRHRARWSAPATLALRVTPAHASAELERYRVDPDGRARLEHVATFGGEAAVPNLEPGSYRLRLVAEGHARTLAPLSLSRGSTVEVALRLPPVTAVPPGFVHVPAGRFPFGGAMPDSMRRSFFKAVPLHDVELGAFLIARHEVTFADWMLFLRDLSPAERARRLPRGGLSGERGSIALEERAGGSFRLRLQPKDAAFVALEGEPVRYPSRARRAVQDWRRFPVTGVSAEDLLVYAAWLDRTGRVPGARACTDLEWERAARGADAREYPHGERVAPDDANLDATYGLRPETFGPDEVGAHPDGQSPFGLDDLCGNAWEWVRSSLVPGEWVLRGGSSFFDADACRIANRQPTEPSLRDPTVGVRLCADAR